MGVPARAVREVEDAELLERWRVRRWRPAARLRAAGAPSAARRCWGRSAADHHGGRDRDAEFGRVWRRGSAPLPQETDRVLQAAAEAAAETVQVALGRLSGGVRPPSARCSTCSPRSCISFGSVRGLAHVLRGQRAVGPFRNVVLGRPPHPPLRARASSLAFASRHGRLPHPQTRPRARGWRSGSAPGWA